MDNGNRKLIKTHLDAILFLIEDSTVDDLIKWKIEQDIFQIKQTLKLNEVD